jgi:hypothetical protein
VPVLLRLTNSSGANNVLFQIGITDAGGNSYVCRGKFGGNEVDLGAIGITLGKSSVYYFSGMTGATVAGFQVV